MATTASIKNGHQPAPKWFRKTKKALTLLSDTAIVMLLAMGYADNSFIMLCLRVGLSGVLQTLEVILADEETYIRRRPLNIK